MRAPNIDSYGPEARLAAVVDHLEAEVLRTGADVELSVLEEHLSESRQRGLFEPVSSLLGGMDSGRDDNAEGDDVSSAEEVEDQLLTGARLPVFSRHNLEHTIMARASALGAHYPFVLTGASLGLSREAIPGCYLVLLAVSQLHAQGDRTVRREFETIAARCLRAGGFRTVELGGARGGFKRFADAMQDALAELQVRRPTFRPDLQVRAATNDGGVDLLARLPHRLDTEDAAFTVAAQVTCRKSDELRGKLGSVASRKFREWFGWPNTPVAALIVPYEFERQHRLDIRHGLEEPTWILTRADLVALRPEMDPSEAALVARLRRTPD